ncbi:eukaryotic translation initiation factor 4b [Lasius niger]|uniref:Eukaryotic translation initiation factor 4b n=1 Tax=Lasius niger TaxID=67767 RepID=A0A0J7L276_LASNI|nr:eukaryotic translation initiation factor 4b [Lasius niger]
MTAFRDSKERKDISSRRNGEGRDDKERGRPTWRSEEDRATRVEKSAPRPQLAPARSEEQNESKASPTSRPEPPTFKVVHKSTEKDTRATLERDHKEKEKEKDEISRMPKAKDEQAPNFVASNKYSMLPDDADPDNIDE